MANVHPSQGGQRPGPTRPGQPRPVPQGQPQAFQRFARRSQQQHDYDNMVRGVRGVGKDYGLRVTRDRSRLAEIGNSMLGRPYSQDQPLPQFMGEGWYRGTDQTIATGTQTKLEYTVSMFDTDRSDFPPLYVTADDQFAVPPGMSGIWGAHGVIRWAADAGAAGDRLVEVFLGDAGGVLLYSYRNSNPGNGTNSLFWETTYPMNENERLTVYVTQSRGSNLDVLGGRSLTHAVFYFKGLG